MMLDVNLHILNKLKYLASEHGTEFTITPSKNYPDHHVIAVGEHSYVVAYFNEESFIEAYCAINSLLMFDKYKRNNLNEILNG